MKKLLLGLCFFSGLAFAVPEYSDWEVVFSSSEDGKVYYMPSSLEVDSSGNKLLWFRLEDPKTDDGNYALEMLSVTDCENNLIGGSHVIAYDKNDRKIEEYEMVSFLADLHPVDEDDLFEKVAIKLMCN